MTKKKIQSKLQTQIPQIPVKWHMPDNIITRYASNIVVQTIETEFKISFFELKPEIRLQGEPPLQEISADCVASVILTADTLQKLIGLLQQQLELYNKRSSNIPNK